MLVRYLGKQFATKKALTIPVCKGQITVQKVKNKPRENIFSNAKKRQTAGVYFVVEVFVLQKYKSKNNNDFLENAFIMSFSVFINAFFCTIWLYLTKRACCVCVCRIFGHCACCLLKRPIVDKPRQKEYSFPDGDTTCNTQSGAICTFTHNTVLTVRLQ